MAHNLLFTQIIARMASFCMGATAVKRDEPWRTLPPMQLLIHPEFSQILTQYCRNDSVFEDSAATLAVRRSLSFSNR